MAKFKFNIGDIITLNNETYGNGVVVCYEGEHYGCYFKELDLKGSGHSLNNKLKTMGGWWTWESDMILVNRGHGYSEKFRDLKTGDILEDDRGDEMYVYEVRGNIALISNRYSFDEISDVYTLKELENLEYKIIILSQFLGFL